MTRTAILMVLMVSAFGARAETVQLFQPGQSSFEWLLSDHGGGKSLRKGMTCQQCHDASDQELFKNSLPVDVTLSETETDYLITLSWSSDAKAVDASLMLDNNQVTAFEKTGCWASCHGDLKGMDQSMDLGKYLGASRKKLTRSGGGENYKPDAALDELMAKGEYVELWHLAASEDSTRVTQSTLLKAPQPMDNPTITGRATRKDGQWRVVFTQPKNAKNSKGFGSDGQYTLGIAIHQDNQGHDHWVSLPLVIEEKNGKLRMADQ